MKDNYPPEADSDLPDLIARLKELRDRHISSGHWKEGSAYDDAVRDAVAFLIELNNA